jgi:glycosyltransferase involved in cell wall biosynthesis
MWRLLEDANLRQMLVERGYTQAQKFSWATCADKVLSILESVPEAGGMGYHPTE